MSTVLWANILKDGKVVSDEADKYALYKHLRKLDKISKENGLRELSGFLDHTDMKINVMGEDLPENIKSTDELMAREGVWINAQDALDNLISLKDIIEQKKIKFGIFSDKSKDIIRELEESIKWTEKALIESAKFNFSVVM